MGSKIPYHRAVEQHEIKTVSGAVLKYKIYVGIFPEDGTEVTLGWDVQEILEDGTEKFFDCGLSTVEFDGVKEFSSEGDWPMDKKLEAAQRYLKFKESDLIRRTGKGIKLYVEEQDGRFLVLGKDSCHRYYGFGSLDTKEQAEEFIRLLREE